MVVPQLLELECGCCPLSHSPVESCPHGTVVLAAPRAVLAKGVDDHCQELQTLLRPDTGDAAAPVGSRARSQSLTGSQRSSHLLGKRLHFATLATTHATKK
jgi:hypothetical protein